MGCPKTPVGLVKKAIWPMIDQGVILDKSRDSTASSASETQEFRLFFSNFALK
jgi:hypothetical protein